MPAPVQPSRSGVEDGCAIHRAELRIHPRGRSAQGRGICRERIALLCDDDGQLRNFSVRNKDGSVRFRVHATGDVEYLDLSLAPDASRIAYVSTTGQAAVTDSTGRSVQLPASFRPEGWLNPTTVVGVLQTSQGDGDMALVQLDRPTRPTDLGFRGFFVGVVQG